MRVKFLSLSLFVISLLSLSASAQLSPSGPTAASAGVAGSQAVGGDVASGSVTAINPIRIGIDSSSGPTIRALQSIFQPGDNDQGLQLLGVGLTVNNGTNQDKVRDARLATFPTSGTLTARNSIGAIISEKGSRWSATSAPAAGSQATASIAAEASVRHVVDCISFTAAAATAPAATALTVNLRDGASGAGTALWTFSIVAPASVGTHATYGVCGLNLVGTTNTATTLEFAAGLANELESVQMSGFNVN
jgi:hypothetical protein